VFVVSLAQAILPTMSRQAASEDLDGFRESLHFALILIMLVTIPAAVGLVLCNQAVYSLFFMRGSFSVFDVSQSAIALAWYAPGLLFVGLSRVAVPCFYAMKDTRTPVIISFWTLLVNVVSGLLLMQFMGHAGLALALTIASVFNALILIVLLAKRLGKLDVAGIVNTTLRTIPGLCAMAIVVSLILSQADWLTAGPFMMRLVVLCAAVLSGSLVYVIGLWVFGVREIKQVWSMIAGRLLLPRKG